MVEEDTNETLFEEQIQEETTIDDRMKKKKMASDIRIQVKASVFLEARCSSVVEHLLMKWWVVEWIPHVGPIELFLISSSAPRLV